MRRLPALALALTAGCVIAVSVGEARAGKIRLAQNSAVTTCMMTCNSQSAACQTNCLVPGTPPTNAATTTSNANVSTTCQLGCSTQQISCQSVCSRIPPPASTALPPPVPNTQVPAQ